jgi:hypothetical protein
MACSFNYNIKVVLGCNTKKESFTGSVKES